MGIKSDLIKFFSFHQNKAVRYHVLQRYIPDQSKWDERCFLISDRLALPTCLVLHRNTPIATATISTPVLMSKSGISELKTSGIKKLKNTMFMPKITKPNIIVAFIRLCACI